MSKTDTGMTNKEMTRVAEMIVTALMAGKIPATGGGKTLKSGETRSERNEKLAVRAFKRAGYGDDVPREDRRTYKGWLEVGRRVRKGEKSIKAGSLRLFHVTQTDVENAKDEATDTGSTLSEESVLIPRQPANDEVGTSAN